MTSASADAYEPASIQITFHHDGVHQNDLPENVSSEQVEEFLEQVWNQFGLLSLVEYDDTAFRSCELRYWNYPRTILAKAALEDPVQVQAAVAQVVKYNKLYLELSKLLFVENKDDNTNKLSGSSLIAVSWKKP